MGSGPTWTTCTPVARLSLADDPDTFAELKVKEIKNRRLAMVSILGHYVQALVTKEGPVANWTNHLADPAGNNIFSYTSTQTGWTAPIVHTLDYSSVSCSVSNPPMRKLTMPSQWYELLIIKFCFLKKK